LPQLRQAAATLSAMPRKRSAIKECAENKENELIINNRKR